MARFGFIDVFNEFWPGWRLFELAFIHHALRVLYRPGLGARESVPGACKRQDADGWTMTVDGLVLRRKD